MKKEEKNIKDGIPTFKEGRKTEGKWESGQMEAEGTRGVGKTEGEEL